MSNLISLNLQSSKFAWLSGSIFCLLLLALLANSNAILAYQFMVMVVMLTVLALVIFQQQYKPIRKLDILLWLNIAIIWQQDKLIRAQIIGFWQVGYLAIVLKLKIQDKRRQLIIFYDSIPTTQYKQLMRHIRWQN